MNAVLISFAFWCEVRKLLIRKFIRKMMKSVIYSKSLHHFKYTYDLIWIEAFENFILKELDVVCAHALCGVTSKQFEHKNKIRILLQPFDYYIFMYHATDWLLPIATHSLLSKKHHQQTTLYLECKHHRSSRAWKVHFDTL